MKAPIDRAKGRVVGYDHNRGELLIRAPYADHITLTKREYTSCVVELIDNRPLSDKQRRMCYALIGEIAEYTGNGKDTTKEWMKLKFMVEDLDATAESLFSLSSAPMSLVCAFQRFLIRFILEWDIPCKFSLLEYVDDIDDYIYACLINKKCCITGRPAQLHHVERVGMGRNREEIIHEGMEVLPLSAEMHQEAHTMPDDQFFEKYHKPNGIIADKTICRISKLKRRS